jgi:diaminopimelate decarboxylase
MSHPAGEQESRCTYLDRIRADLGPSGVWDYLRYDEHGLCWINGLRVVDALRRYGAPLEIVDTTLVVRRCAEWRALCHDVAAGLGYPGAFHFLYAAKANMASEVAHAAYRSGWGAETSSRQDLIHLEWLRREGLVPEGMRVVCNGFKLARDKFTLPQPDPGAARSSVVLPPGNLASLVRDATYAEAIIAMARDGWHVQPVLDLGELDAFSGPAAPALDVGLRMKLGRVRNLEELDSLVNRFGMDLPALTRTADQVAASGNLRLVSLHGMVGAAETIPPDEYVAGLLVAADVWVELASRHPSLRELNVGGGMPPLGEPYDHRGVLRAYLVGLMARSQAAGLAPPDVTFELGSLVAAESSFHAFRVLQLKRNHQQERGSPAPAVWAIVDGGLMAAIPDMLLLGKPFRIVAVEGACQPALRVRLGDVTCDSDGRYPPKSFGNDAAVWLPAGDGPQHVLILGVGAYQEILAGVRGAHHCGLLEASELILEERADGKVHGRLMPRQTTADAAKLLGYTQGAADALRQTVERGGQGPRPGPAT